MNTSTKTFFAPQLNIRRGTKNIDFYIQGLGAVEIRRLTNDDGTVHVAEFTIDGALFHLHEENINKGVYEPGHHNGVTAIIGLFVEDVDAIMDRAIAAGATLISPAQDYDYGYRQGVIQDPFGHRWMIEKRI